MAKFVFVAALVVRATASLPFGEECKLVQASTSDEAALVQVAANVELRSKVSSAEKAKAQKHVAEAREKQHTRLNQKVHEKAHERAHEKTQHHVEEAHEQAQKAEQFPDIGGMVNGIVGGVVGDVASSLVTVAATQFVHAVNSSMATVDQQASELLQQCMGARNTITASMNSVNATLHDRASELEALINSTVSAILPRWVSVGSAFDGVISVLRSALSATGHEVPTVLDDLLTQSTEIIALVTTTLNDTQSQVAGLHSMAEQEIATRLNQLNATLEAGLSGANSTAQSLDQSFGAMLDQAAGLIAATIPSAEPAQLRPVFETLRTSEAHIFGLMLSSLDTLVSGLALGTSRAQEMLSAEALAHSGATRSGVMMAVGVAAVAGLLGL